jgi:hypothetical protein
MEAKQTKKGAKGLIENQSYISISEFGRGLLRLHNNKGKSGTFISSGLKLRRLVYYVDLDSDPPCLFIYIQNNNDSQIKIHLKHTYSTFGIRPYFACPKCQSLRCKLYMKEGALLCRKCLNLVHESTRLHLVHPLIRIFKKQFKIVEISERVKRISYNGKFTRRAKRVMELSRRLKVDVKA